MFEIKLMQVSGPTPGGGESYEEYVHIHTTSSRQQFIHCPRCGEYVSVEKADDPNALLTGDCPKCKAEFIEIFYNK